MPPNAQRGGGSTRDRGGARNPGIQPQLWNLIRAYSQRLNLDPYAVAAVSRVEGGGRFGEVGDNNSSYGPFQLHRGGALPPGWGAAEANSAKGVWYAMSHMAASGAAGLRGLPAVQAIVTRFERPANPRNEVTSAFAGYKAFGAGLPGVVAGAADTGNYKVFTPTDPHWLAQISRIQAQQTHAFQQAQQSLLQNLKTQAAQGRQSALAQSLAAQLSSHQQAFGQAQQGVSGGGAAPGGVPAQGLYQQNRGLLDTIRLHALQRAGLA